MKETRKEKNTKRKLKFEDKNHSANQTANRNPNWWQVPDHPYRMSVIVNYGPGKTNALLNLISYKPDIYEIHLYAKNQFEVTYQLLTYKG